MLLRRRPAWPPSKARPPAATPGTRRGARGRSELRGAERLLARPPCASWARQGLLAQRALEVLEAPSRAGRRRQPEARRRSRPARRLLTTDRCSGRSSPTARAARRRTQAEAVRRVGWSADAVKQQRASAGGGGDPPVAGQQRRSGRRRRRPRARRAPYTIREAAFVSPKSGPTRAATRSNSAIATRPQLRPPTMTSPAARSASSSVLLCEVCSRTSGTASRDQPSLVNVCTEFVGWARAEISPASARSRRRCGAPSSLRVWEQLRGPRAPALRRRLSPVLGRRRRAGHGDAAARRRGRVGR